MIWAIVVMAAIIFALMLILSQPDYEKQSLRQQVIQSSSHLMTIFKQRQEIEFQVNMKNSYRAALEQVANCNEADKHFGIWVRTMASVVLGYNEGREKYHAKSN